MKKRAINTGIFMLTMTFSWLFVGQVLSRLLRIPDDPCHYHIHHASGWVDRFFIDEGGHVSRNGNLSMLILIIAFSSLITLTAAMLRNRRLARH